MPSISNVWEQVVALLDDGVSIIPIRDKDETTKSGKTKTKKSPYQSWEKYQTELIKKEELWYLMERYETSAIATLCGKISGGLEAIDVDVKNKPGCDKELFDEIKAVMPGLIDRLRINKTPSGGWHLLYRVEIGFVVPASKKLASRFATQEEIAADTAERPSKFRCFIETRGEGGYVAAPPSLDYKTVQDRPLPVLTGDERNKLIAICQSFNTYYKDEPSFKLSSQESIYYDENPFQSFNKSGVAEHVLLNNGWTLYSNSSRFIYFTRPGSKSGGIHAAFMKASRLYRFFTTNCEFDNDKSFHPATVRAVLEFGGDKKRLHPVLVGEGYGKLKAEAEKKIVKNAVLSGRDLPTNISPEAKELYAEKVIQHATVHPYGVFWQIGSKDGFEISREDIYRVADLLGFRLWKDNLYQLDGNFLHKRTDQEFFDTLNGYVFDDDGDVQKEICNCLEAFFQKSGEYTIGRLRQIKKEQIFSDTRNDCYKFYLNCYLHITADSITICELSTIKGYVFYERVQQRNFRFGDVGGHYIDFLNKACHLDHRPNLQSIVGYLSHDYRDSTTPYIIVLTEECEDPKKGGGSGKNLFCTLLKHTITITNKNGAQIQKVDERFLQAWNGERLLSIDDVPKNFDYTSLKDMSSGSAIIKKLYKDERVVECEDMCKFIIQSNYGVNKADGGIERRIRQIEFTDYFTQKQGVNTHYGIQFPDGWKEEDWIGYDNFIAQCVQKWLAGGLVLEREELTEGGWLKEFDQLHGKDTRLFIEQNMEFLLKKKTIPISEFNSLYNAYCDENNVHERYRKKGIYMNDALEAWCKKFNYVFEKNKADRVPGYDNAVKCKVFEDMFPAKNVTKPIDDIPF